MVSEVVVLDTDAFSVLFVATRRSDPRRSAWKAALIGRTVAIAAQTRGDLLARDGWMGKAAPCLSEDTVDRNAMTTVDHRLIDMYAELRAACCNLTGHTLGGKMRAGDRVDCCDCHCRGCGTSQRRPTVRGRPRLAPGRD